MRVFLVLLIVMPVTVAPGTTRAQSGQDMRVPATVDVEGQAVNGILSPDGSKILWVSRRLGNREIWIANADGSEARPLTRNSAIDYSPDWSPDGTTVAWCSTQSGHHEIWEIEVDGGTATQVTETVFGARMPRYSSDGRLAWHMLKGDQGKMPPSNVVVRTGDGKEQVILEDVLVCDYAWNPVGDTLAVGTASEIVFCNMLDQQQQRVPAADIDEQLFAHGPSDMQWEPDGDRIACQILFLGGRTAGTRIFGDDEYFLVSPDGNSEVFENLETIRVDHPWVHERQR